MRIIITVTFLLTTFFSFSQDTLILGEVDWVNYLPNTVFPEIDSTVSAMKIDSANNGFFTYCDDIIIYFDKQKKKIAYRSKSFGDSCSTFDYWRNGNLKLRVNYVMNEDLFPVWVSKEVYCANGQLINKGKSTNMPGRTLHTEYYCNGNKKIEFHLLQGAIDGKMTSWYENGNIKSEAFYNLHTPIGLWKYYDTNGKLIKTEKYDNGELIETKEF